MRRSLKRCVFAVCVVLVSPLIAISYIEKRLSAGETLFTLFAQLFAVLPGIVGVYLRGAYYFGTLDDCSWETHVGFGSIFVHRGAVLADRASMGSYCVVGHAKIGTAVMMGSRVSVPSGKHQHIGRDGAVTAGTNYGLVQVGERTWIGEGAIILANVGSDCIIGAGAVVTSQMPDGVVAGGNPARVIRGGVP